MVPEVPVHLLAFETSTLITFPDLVTGSVSELPSGQVTVMLSPS